MNADGTIDPTTLLIAVGLVDLLIIGACVVIGSSKGRTGEGLIFGLFLGPIGLIITLFLRKAPTPATGGVVTGPPAAPWLTAEGYAPPPPPPPS